MISQKRASFFNGGGKVSFSEEKGSFLGKEAPVNWASAQIRGVKKNSWGGGKALKLLY